VGNCTRTANQRISGTETRGRITYPGHEFPVALPNRADHARDGVVPSPVQLCSVSYLPIRSTVPFPGKRSLSTYLNPHVVPPASGDTVCVARAVCRKGNLCVRDEFGAIYDLSFLLRQALAAFHSRCADGHGA